MSDLGPEFNRLEKYSQEMIVCSFETKRFGYYQVGFDGSKTVSLNDEPNIKMFPIDDEQKIRSMLAIAWKLVHDAPAAKHRFER